MFRHCLTIALTVLVLTPATEAEWWRFRGPNGSGISREAVPTTWSPGENLRWKTALPGPGGSNPIIVGDRVFVTCYSGYGINVEEPGDENQLRRHVCCLNVADGSMIWTKDFEPYLPEDPYRGMGVPEHGYATHTPVTDGERLYVFFGKSGVHALDLDGNELWSAEVGTESGSRGWGTSSSPLLHENVLIVPATAESQSMIGLDKRTGKELWRQKAGGFESVWGTPVLVPVDDNRTDLVVFVPGEIWGLNPNNGKLTWYCDAMTTNSACSSVIHDGGIIYAIEQGMGGGGGIAIRKGGKQDVGDSHVIWRGRQSSRIDTPVCFDGHLYSIAGQVIQRYDAATGEAAGKLRLKTSGVAEANDDGDRTGRRRGRGRGRFSSQNYSSPIVAGDKLYFQSRRGDGFVISTGEDLKQLSVNRLSDDENEEFIATPAVANGALFIRSSKSLYCIAAP